MLEDTEKKLQKLRGEEVSKRDEVSEIPENTDKVSEIPENTEITEITETTAFEQLLRKKIKENGIVEVFEGGGGTLKMHAVQIIDRGLFLSLCTNAVLFVLLLTHIVGVW